MAGKCIIVMGVCGSGKSSVGLKVAEALGAKFIDGDDLHPKANIQKMAGGNPLNDEDRAPWLERIRDAAYSLEQKNETGIIVCSALKKKYRDQPQEEIDAASEAAKRIKAYIRYKIFDQMDGEEIIEELSHNALVGHYGIVKVCHRDDYDVETQVLDRVSSDELLQLAAQLLRTDKPESRKPS